MFGKYINPICYISMMLLQCLIIYVLTQVIQFTLSSEQNINARLLKIEQIIENKQFRPIPTNSSEDIYEPHSTHDLIHDLTQDQDQDLDLSICNKRKLVSKVL